MTLRLMCGVCRSNDSGNQVHRQRPLTSGQRKGDALHRQIRVALKAFLDEAVAPYRLQGIPQLFDTNSRSFALEELIDKLHALCVPLLCFVHVSSSSSYKTRRDAVVGRERCRGEPDAVTIRWPIHFGFRGQRAVAQLGSALVWGTRGRGFKSRQPDHIPYLLRVGEGQVVR